MQWQADAQGFVGINHLEINVLNLAAEGVHLEITHDDSMGFAIYRQFQQGGVERFFFQSVEQGFVIHCDGLGFLLVAIKHSGDFAFATQAAARTRTFQFAFGGFNLIRHGFNSKKTKNTVCQAATNPDGVGLREDESARCGNVLVEEVRYGFFVADAAYGFGQQARDADLADAAALFGGIRQGDGVGNDHLVDV